MVRSQHDGGWMDELNIRVSHFLGDLQILKVDTRVNPTNKSYFTSLEKFAFIVGKLSTYLKRVDQIR